MNNSYILIAHSTSVGPSMNAAIPVVVPMATHKTSDMNNTGHPNLQSTMQLNGG